MHSLWVDHARGSTTMNLDDDRESPGHGPLDRPEREVKDPIGDDAYPGGSGMMPPTGDMEDPIPETGMPGEPELEPGPKLDEQP
jgi:hypothetical protein